MKNFFKKKYIAKYITNDRKAAKQGDAEAQFSLGLGYDTGQGEALPQDEQKAVYWYKKAAEQGNADAQFILGNMYENGEGVPEDYQQAVYWYKKAAEQGNAGAQLILGKMYFTGEGVTQGVLSAGVHEK